MRDDLVAEQVEIDPLVTGPAFRAAEHAAVEVPEAFETVGNFSGKATLFNSRFQQLGGHHGRQGQRDDSGNRDGSGQGKGEFTKERAGQASLQTDGGIDRGQGNGHGDDGTDQFAGAQQGGIERRLAFTQVPLNIFDHHDGIVDHETHRQYHAQQGEEIDGKSEHLHQECRTDQRKRDGDHRDECRS